MAARARELLRELKDRCRSRVGSGMRRRLNGETRDLNDSSPSARHDHDRHHPDRCTIDPDFRLYRTLELLWAVPAQPLQRVLETDPATFDDEHGPASIPLR